MQNVVKNLFNNNVQNVVKNLFNNNVQNVVSNLKPRSFALLRMTV